MDIVTENTVTKTTLCTEKGCVAFSIAGDILCPAHRWLVKHPKIADQIDKREKREKKREQDRQQRDRNRT